MYIETNDTIPASQPTNQPTSHHPPPTTFTPAAGEEECFFLQLYEKIGGSPRDSVSWLGHRFLPLLFDASKTS